ncbi:peptidase C14, caspase domain-containing protein, partial [Rhodocollybia butyracea]
AVIVGINRYDDLHTPALKGCVHDALLFREYLIQDLSVPSDRITLLLSPTANILNALYTLCDNSKIKSDDSIVFFYAGHGQSYSPRTWTPHPTSSIEAISPVDRETVLDISDREINVILGEIAKKRCDNITLILDCCHASAGIRG